MNILDKGKRLVSRLMSHGIRPRKPYWSWARNPMSLEELQRRFNELSKPRGPKKVFMKDGELIAGEKLSYGDLVYFQKVKDRRKRVESL